MSSAARDEIIATYLAELPADNSERAAEAFATGQSIGTWLPVPGITPYMREVHGARVVELAKPDADAEVAGERASERWILKVGFPVVNFGSQFPMMLTTLVGNDPSTSLAARLVDIEPSEGYLSAFGGPVHGIAGWRTLTGVQNRPLVLNMIKPCTGYPPDIGADLLELSARGGCDLIKDDELLADPTFNRVAERARLYKERLEQVADETGHRARYVANVTDRSRQLIDNARAAVEGGADAVMINVFAAGLDALQTLAEEDIGVPILAHTACSEVLTGGEATGLGQPVLYGKIVRLAGADAIIMSTPLAMRPLPQAVFDTTARWLVQPWGHLRPTMPCPAGGLTADGAVRIMKELGIDIILGIGGAIQGHPEGAEAGAREVMAAIEAAASKGS